LSAKIQLDSGDPDRRLTISHLDSNRFSKRKWKRSAEDKIRLTSRHMPAPRRAKPAHDSTIAKPLNPNDI
jgi:hypothetical protein